MDDEVRLIDANALHKEITSFDHSVIYKDWVQSAIASAPTISDVVPVVHANGYSTVYVHLALRAGRINRQKHMTIN